MSSTTLTSRLSLAMVPSVSVTLTAKLSKIESAPATLCASVLLVSV